MTADQITKEQIADALTKVGKAKSYIWNLVHGKKLPSMELARTLEHDHGIPPTVWTSGQLAAPEKTKDLEPTTTP